MLKISSLKLIRFSGYISTCLSLPQRKVQLCKYQALNVVQTLVSAVDSLHHPVIRDSEVHITDSPTSAISSISTADAEVRKVNNWRY